MKTALKTIGLIGGISWESTVVYYQLLNRAVRARLGGLHSAKILLHSVEFDEVAGYQAAGDWDRAGDVMVEAAQSVERGGADCLLIGANTMHLCADAVMAAVDIPLIHIADVTAAAIKQAGCQNPLLLATRYTMEKDFYKGRLHDQHGVTACIPEADERTVIHDIIYRELCQGIIEPGSKDAYRQIIDKHRQGGADGVIFGCTEIGLLLDQGDVSLPVFDTTALHAAAAVDFALSA
ncbi:MAG: aspartate/glutamate racemase family protein [Pseudomonadota bacterium]